MSKAIDVVEQRNLALGRMMAKACDDRRADEIMLLDVREVCDFADYFVIATVTSQPQMRGLAKEIDRIMEAEKVRALSREGVQASGWAVLDYGDVIAHIFAEEQRAFYRLEDLWGDAPAVAWEE